MNGLRIGHVVALATLLVAATATAREPRNAKPAAHNGVVACRDGTMVPKGAKSPCAGHDGPATDATQTDPPPDKPPRGAGNATDPANATAQCKDGTFSHAARHAGACGQNGGVAKWLDQMPPDGGRPRE
jgi:hypothetical protein